MADVRRVRGGSGPESFALDVRFDADTQIGARSLILRSDAARAVPGSLNREAEHAVAEALFEAGVPVPRPILLGRDVVRDGAWARLEVRLEGTTDGRTIVRSPAYGAAREVILDELCEALAALHAITPSTHPALADVLGEPPDRPAHAAIERLRTTLDRLDRPLPGCEIALRWLDRDAPVAPATTLVHGDLRTGNLLVTPVGLVAILDLERAHWSDPAEDLGWFCVRDFRFRRDDRPAGGFATRDALREAYAIATGRTIDGARQRWWEVLGNARRAAECALQGERFTRGEHDDVNLLATSRRAAESEWEALALLP